MADARMDAYSPRVPGGVRFAVHACEDLCAPQCGGGRNRVLNGNTITPPPGGFPIATFAIRTERDLVSLRRESRAAAAQSGLDDRHVRSFSTAAYEAGRLLFALTESGSVALRIVDGPAVQCAITVEARHADAVRRAIHDAASSLRALVDRFSVDESDAGVSVSLSIAVPAGAAQSMTVRAGVGAAGQHIDPAAGLKEQNAALERALLEIQAELEETNRGVVAMYAELDDQTARLRAAEAALRSRAEELAAANRAKEDFLATLSHELRTPLNAMLGWTRLLRLDKLDPAARARALETIERNARVQEQLIADILDVSRIVTGKLRLQLRPISLEPIIDASLDAVRPTAEAKGIALTCDIAFAGTVLGDPDRLQQVCWNLLANAIKFTPPGGRVAIHLSRSGPNAVLTVADNGEGMPPELVPVVFDRFTQGDGSVTRPHGGLGLGLSIVRHIVELHGGQVEASSAGKGSGSRFSVRIPVRAVQHAAEAMRRASEPPLSGLKVLVVDDDPDTREVVSMALADCGAKTAAAGSAREALQILPEFQPDVLISDIGMPGEDGYVLIRRVRAMTRENVAAVPAVALTGLADADERRRALLAGYQRFVPKPVEAAELAAVVRSLAETRAR